MANGDRGSKTKPSTAIAKTQLPKAQLEGVIEPVQGRSKLSTRRLLDAAATLIADRGYEQASLAAIGERAGYSRGLVTARFGTKENLLNSLVERITADWAEHEVLPKLEGLSSLDAMLTYLDRVADQWEKDPIPVAALWSLAFEALRAESPLRERFVPFHKGVMATVRRYIEGGIKDGSIRPDVNARTEALMYTATIRGIIYHWLLLRDDAEVQRMFAEFHHRVDTLLRNPKRRARTAAR